MYFLRNEGAKEPSHVPQHYMHLMQVQIPSTVHLQCTNLHVTTCLHVKYEMGVRKHEINQLEH